jgi:hypothetical protein
MHRHAIDRWTDTTAFRFMLLFASVAVVPVLALGVLTTVIGAGTMIVAGATLEFVHAAFGALSLGGALGLLGYLRAHAGAKHPERHGVTATLLCLAAGIATALAVAGVALSGALSLWENPWDARPWVAAPLLFAVANLVWATSGVAWMQRLLSRYAARTGRAFDGLPVVLLSLSIALAVAAALNMATL